MINNVKISFLFCLFCFSQAAFSQIDSTGLFRLNENDIVEGVMSSKVEVVSASRSSKYVEDLPVTVYVVTREEILKNGYITLVDVLRSVPGIKVSQPGSGVEGETFLLRGLFGNYYAKILVDNIPIQPSVVSGMPIADQLPIRQAERIEIIFGPASAIYGADAMAGVINIITKTSERPVYAQADIALGTYGYTYMNALIGGKVGKNKNVMKYKFYGSAGFRNDMNVKYDIPDLYNPYLYDSTYSYTNAPYYRGDSTSPEMNKLPQVSQLIGATLNWRGFRMSYDNMYRMTHSSIGLATDFYGYYDPRAEWGERIHRITAGFDHSWKKVSSTTNLSYLRYRLNNLSYYSLIYDGGVQGTAYKYAASDDLFFEELITYNIIENLEAVFGFSFQYSGNLPKTNDLDQPFNTDLYKSFSNEKPQFPDSFDAFGYNPLTFSNTAGFLQLYYGFKRFTFIAGTRYDYNSYYGGNQNPRLAAMFDIHEKMSLRASFASAFRVPSTFFSFSSLAYKTPDGVFYETIPNIDINPEKFNSIEVGYRFNTGKMFSLDVAAYTHSTHEKGSLSAVVLDTVKYPDATNPNGLSASYVNDENSSSRLFGLQTNLRLKNIVPSVKMNADLFISLAKGNEVLPNDLGDLDNYRLMPLFYTQLNISLSPIPEVFIAFENTISSKWEKRFFPIPPEEMEKRGIQTTVNGYYRLDFIARFMLSDNFQAFIDIENIFNSHYGGIDASGTIYDLVYNPQYGRSVMFGLSFAIE